MKSIKLIKVTAIDLNLTKTSKAGKPYSVAHIEYTQPQGDNTDKVFATDIFHGTLKSNPAMGETIKTLEVGTEVGLEKTQDGNFWPVTGFVAVADVPAPKPAYTGGGGFKKSSSSGPKDTAGIKVGAVMHDAVAMAVAQKKDLVTVADVTTVAEQLLTAAFVLEDRVRAGDFKGTTTPSVGVKVVPPTTNAPTTNNTLDNKIDSLDTNTKMGSLPF